ncbi:hypothetical protein IG193_05505 [Infirmifilum lucidum]|uniref:Uncharacterized protein n=1 Tax=Infirmifilum lucidum TaxID=2776706 RepID=A0A7L9FEK9_9CREN|nr:hypothetical protein [Infirmifilum lucidum]QOJ78230.1 hypothetical protein IG193_05505 [Infirmifilum lucidum]
MSSYTTLKKRFTRALRVFGPKPNDVITIVTLENLQSLVLLELTLAVEQDYDVQVHHLHLGGEIPRIFTEKTSSSTRIVSSKSVYGNITSYTDVKTTVVSLASEYPGALFILPFTADDLACYFLREVLRGNLAGLALEAQARVAYPLYTTTLQEIEQAYSGSPLEPALLAQCDLLRELKGRISLQAFGNFYVEVYVKRAKALLSCSSWG